MDELIAFMKPNSSSGTSMILVLICTNANKSNNKVYVANAGTSRAIICSNEKSY